MRRALACLLLSGVLAGSAAAWAASPPSFQLSIGESSFSPATLVVPAGVRLQLLVKNERRQPAEFESFDLNREKVVLPGAVITVWIGPLPAGRYKFFDDFNPKTTGWLVAGGEVHGSRP